MYLPVDLNTPFNYGFFRKVTESYWTVLTKLKRFHPELSVVQMLREECGVANSREALMKFTTKQKSVNVKSVNAC